MQRIYFKIRSFVLILTTSLGPFFVSAQYDSLPHNNINRTYLLHLPPGYTGNTPTPLVIAMHGGLGSANNLESQSLLSVKADTENFIVVYPEGVKNALGIRTWNAGWCCGYASNNNIDDVGFISTLIDTLTSQLNIDTMRIYATGMSNGGFMSYRLACELSNRIAAIAPVAASLSIAPCNPSRPVPIIQFHSYQDTNVPAVGGIGNGVSNHYNSPHDSVLNVWSVNNGCLVTNDTIINNSMYTFIKWHMCHCLVEIDYYITQDGGHSWPGGTATPIGDPPSTAINANDLMWDFFQLHSLECIAASVSESEDILSAVYPNPSDNIFYLNTPTETFFSVSNSYGVTVLIGSGKSNKTVIDLSAYADGLYIVNLIHGNRSQTVKLIKIKN